MDSPNTTYDELVQKMRQRAITFDTHLTKLKNVNSELIARADRILNALKDLLGTVKCEPKRFCTVCCTREPRIVFQCGHVSCSSCADRAKSGRNRCFTCRAPIESAIRIFL